MWKILVLQLVASNTAYFAKIDYHWKPISLESIYKSASILYLQSTKKNIKNLAKTISAWWHK